MVGTHHRITPSPTLNRMLAWSVAGHVALLVFLSVTVAHSIRTAPPQALQVRLVGVPQPKASAKKVVEPEPIRTQDSAAPKEPPKNAKNLPDQDATSKFAIEKERPTVKKETLMESKKRPPVLDKTPREKKVVKNEKDAKVVNNPEDFLAALEFVDKLKPSPSSTTAPAPQDKPAGEGPQIQLNLSDQGEVDAIRRHIEQYWMVPPGMDTRQFALGVLVEVSSDGNVIRLQVTSSSGNSAFDNSLLRAVRRASPLPIPSSKYEKFRQLEFTFGGS